MSLGGLPFAESSLAGVGFAGTAAFVPSPGPTPEIGIAPFTVELGGVSMRDNQLVGSIAVEPELGRQGTARFSLVNLSQEPQIGQPVRILFYSQVLFAGAVDRFEVRSRLVSSLVIYDFECTDHASLLFRKILKLSFVNQPLYQIMLGVMSNALGGDGITVGRIDSSVPIPLADADGVNAFEFLSGAAAAVGCVFSIDHNKKMNAISSFTSVNAEPLDAVNIEQLTLTADRETYRNVQTTTVQGKPTSTNEQALTVSLTRYNQEQIASRIAVEGTGGIYSDRVSLVHPSSNSAVELNRLANAYNKIWLGLAGSIRRSLSIRTRQYGYDIGQLVTVELPHLGISGTWVIQRIAMQEEAGMFLVTSLELSQSSLQRRSQELWTDLVRKGTVTVLPPISIYTQIATFATPGLTSWTVPAGVTELQLTGYGPGAGGGGGARSEWPNYGGVRYASGSSGGAGGLVQRVLQVSPGEVLSIWIGTGGAPGVGQYRFESFLDALGSNGTDGTMTWVERSGAVRVLEAYGGIGGIGGVANARGSYANTLPAGQGGGGQYGEVITVGGAGNGGTGGLGITNSNGSSGGAGHLLVEW